MSEKRFTKVVKNPKTGRTKTVKYGQKGATMSDTPETDAQEDASHNFAELVVPSSLARRLERERDEAMDKAERYRLEANSFMLQRDEARNELLKCNEYNDELYRKLKTK